MTGRSVAVQELATMAGPGGGSTAARQHRRQDAPAAVLYRAVCSSYTVPSRCFAIPRFAARSGPPPASAHLRSGLWPALPRLPANGNRSRNRGEVVRALDQTLPPLLPPPADLPRNRADHTCQLSPLGAKREPGFHTNFNALMRGACCRAADASENGSCCSSHL